MAGELKVDASSLQRSLRVPSRECSRLLAPAAQEYVTREESFENINDVFDNFDDATGVRTVLRF